MKEPNVYEEALASSIEAYRQDGIEKYDKALRKALMKLIISTPKYMFSLYEDKPSIEFRELRNIIAAINEAEVEV